MSDTVQKIKERLSIVDVVSVYVKLTRAGKYWKGLSPFTKEKTPSFFVSPDRGLYHCFSSGKGGDMFTFIQEMEGVDFKGALTILAERAGVEIIPEARESRDEREQTLAALEAATQYFAAALQERKDVQSYLEKRGVDAAACARWHIGYAPKEWHALRDALIKKGFSEAILERAGLIKKSEPSESNSGDVRHYDRFRGRIMFPIRDVSGRVIAFSGRIFEDDPEHPQAKYLNSPETPVFDKSRALYGLYEAKGAIRELGASMLVEGQVDLIMAHKVGYHNTVATSGTALTEHHVDILKRYAPNIVVAYDADAAGVNAAGRAAALALSRGMNVKVARLPRGSDPADIAHSDPALFKKAIKESTHVVDFFLTEVRESTQDDRTFRLEVGRVVLPFVAAITNTLDQAHFVQRVAEVLSVPEEKVYEELRKLRTAPNAVGESVSALVFVTRTELLLKLVDGLIVLFTERNDPRLAEATKIRALFPNIVVAAESEARAQLFEAELFLDTNADNEDAALASVYADLHRARAEEQYRETVLKLKEAERDKDTEKVATLMKELAGLAGAIKN